MASSPSLLPLLSPAPNPSSSSERETFEPLRSGRLDADGSRLAAPSVVQCSPIFPLNGDDPVHGFGRADMYEGTLVGSIQLYERHVFLCYKEPESWPSHVEAAEFDRLPRFLAAALKARKKDMPKKTRLTICEGRDGTDSSNGDVLIFPDMVRYKGLTHFDVDAFVDEFLVHNREWLSGKPEKLKGAHVFICCHASRDARCGVCGPVLIGKFREHISSRGLEDHVFVRPCSHIGGHKYAGNVIIYSSNTADQVVGHWYGYVTPDDVPVLLDEHISEGKVLDRLWRGQMGLMEDEQKQAQLNRLQSNSMERICLNGFFNVHEQINGHVNGEGSIKCCQETGEVDNQITQNKEKKIGKHLYRNRMYSGNRFGSTWVKVSSFFESWEREDTLAALTVVGAGIMVAAAYHMHRNSS
eukprot:c21794_g1_i1 orf=172-1407(+)